MLLQYKIKINYITPTLLCIIFYDFTKNCYSCVKIFCGGDMSISFRPENYKQIDYTLSRSAQPRQDNLLWLKSQGVTDIINFRTSMLKSDTNINEEVIAKNYGFNYHKIPTISWRPTEEKVVQFLDIVEGVKHHYGKVHIHCKQGADRTGMYAYIYESLNHIGTTGTRISELYNLGYHPRLYPNLVSWANKFIKNYIK